MIKDFDIYLNGWSNLVRQKNEEVKALRTENTRLENKSADLETTCISLAVVLVLTLIFG